MNSSDTAGMWIVAAILVGVIGAQGVLPDMSPSPKPGVEAVTPRLEFTEPGVAGPIVPPSERSTSVLAKANNELPTPALAEVLHSVAKRVFGC